LVEKSLGIPKWAIYDLCKKVFNRNITDFFPDAKELPTKTKTLLKKQESTHKILTKTPDSVTDQAKQVYKSYGQPSIVFDKLLEELYELLKF
jgi:hypothetical protein